MLPIFAHTTNDKVQRAHMDAINIRDFVGMGKVLPPVVYTKLQGFDARFLSPLHLRP